jgi:hypothetical protein
LAAPTPLNGKADDAVHQLRTFEEHVVRFSYARDEAES